MKKYLGIIALLAALLLAACSETENIPVELGKDENEVRQEETKIGKTKEITDELKASHRMAGYKLMDIIDTYGYVPDLADFYLSEYDHGLVYAKLVDFNKDGKDELFVLFKAMPMLYPETDGYIIEIWGGGFEDGYMPFYSRTIEIDECSACDLSVGLIEFKDGSYGYYESSAQTAQGTTFSNETIYFMKDADSYFDETVVFTSMHNESSTYEVNGEAVEEEEFGARRELYNGTDIPIIKGDFGRKSFVHGAKSSAAVVKAIFEEIDYAFDSAGDDETKVDPASVQAYAERVLYLNDVRANHPHYMRKMLEYVLLYEDLQADLHYTDYFLTISEQAVAEKVKEVFGVELDLSVMIIQDPEDMSDSLFDYRDGTFYILPTDFALPVVIRTVEKAWEVAEDMYYMVVSDIAFDEMAYDNVELTPVDKVDFLYEPITKWPVEARKYAVSDIRRYLLVKVVNGQPTVKYIGNWPLTMDDIKTY